MKKFLFFTFVLILSACASPQVTEETDCCLAVNFTAPVPTETLIPSVTPTVNQTQTAIDDERLAFQTLAAEFPQICEHDYYYPSPDMLSLNGLWLEELCYSDEDQDLILTISNKETKVLWKLLYHDYIPKLDFFPDGGMSVVKWSNDGKYVYFFSFLGGDGYHCFVKGWDTGSGLFRLDLQTGQVTSILSPSNDWWYSFSFSPTDKRLAYSLRSENFFILDMTTGHTIEIDHVEEVYEGGGVVWSPDGLEFAYSTIFIDETSGYFETTVRLVDVRTGKEDIILKTQDDCYVANEWKENRILIIESDAKDILIEFDLNTNTIISETPINP